MLVSVGDPPSSNSPRILPSGLYQLMCTLSKFHWRSPNAGRPVFPCRPRFIHYCNRSLATTNQSWCYGGRVRQKQTRTPAASMYAANLAHESHKNGVHPALWRSIPERTQTFISSTGTPIVNNLRNGFK